MQQPLFKNGVYGMSEQNLEYLRIDHISKSYGVVKALTDVSFTIRQGEIHTILGENGAEPLPWMGSR